MDPQPASTGEWLADSSRHLGGAAGHARGERSTGAYVREFSPLLACKTTTPAYGSSRSFHRAGSHSLGHSLSVSRSGHQMRSCV
jgi:hypothetical protein